jgi:hypothetical protein
MKGSTKLKKSGAVHFPLSRLSPWQGGKDKSAGLEPTHVSLLGLTLSLTKGEASQARMQPISVTGAQADNLINTTRSHSYPWFLLQATSGLCMVACRGRYPQPAHELSAYPERTQADRRKS